MRWALVAVTGALFVCLAVGCDPDLNAWQRDRVARRLLRIAMIGPLCGALYLIGYIVRRINGLIETDAPITVVELTRSCWGAAQVLLCSGFVFALGWVMSRWRRREPRVILRRP